MFNFIIGMFIGSFVGVSMMCLCVVSGKCSDIEDRKEWNDEEDI